MSKSPITIPLSGVEPTRRRMDRRTLRVLKAANDLSHGHSGEFCFMHSVFCQTCLPCKTPLSDVRVWDNINGHSSVHIEAGSAYDPQSKLWTELPIPYGTKARLALIYLSTEAIKTNSPVIKLDRSMTGFLRKVINRQPNANDLSQFKLQMSALGTATIRLATKDRQTNAHIVSNFDLMWLRKSGPRILWPSELELSPGYWSSLKGKAVPLDLTAIKAISHSALAIDIYLWLAQRLWRIDQPYTVYWSVLKRQFGDGYSRIRDFREKFRKALLIATAVYPEAVIKDVITEDGQNVGIRLSKSPPPVPRRK